MQCGTTPNSLGECSCRRSEWGMHSERQVVRHVQWETGSYRCDCACILTVLICSQLVCNYAYMQPMWLWLWLWLWLCLHFSVCFHNCLQMSQREERSVCWGRSCWGSISWCSRSSSQCGRWSTTSSITVTPEPNATWMLLLFLSSISLLYALHQHYSFSFGFVQNAGDEDASIIVFCCCASPRSTVACASMLG